MGQEVSSHAAKSLRPRAACFSRPGADAICLLALATWVSRPSGEVTGKVTYQDRPLTGESSFSFPRRAKGRADPRSDSDGSYSIKTVAGPVKIAVDTKSAQPPSAGDQGPPKSMESRRRGLPNLPPEAAKSGICGSGGSLGSAVSIPENFANTETSGLHLHGDGPARRLHDLL